MEAVMLGGKKLSIEFDLFAAGCLPFALEAMLKNVRAQKKNAFARLDKDIDKMLDDCIGQLESCLASVAEAKQRSRPLIHLPAREDCGGSL
jgi:hypothetical protein